MNLVTGHEPTILDWLARTYGVHVLQTPRLVFGVVDNDGILRGVYVLTWRNDTSAELHVFGAVSNDTAKELFRAAFNGCGLHRLEVRVPRKSKSVRKNALKWGFQFEGLARDYYGPGMDGFTYGMTAAQCRWIRGEHGLSVQVAESA